MKRILVIGAGPVGATFALLAHARGLDVRLIDARPDPRHSPSRETRTLALSHGSQQLLERAGVAQALWGGPQCARIRQIHTSQRGGFGRVQLRSEDADVPALGYVVRYSVLQEALDNALAQTNIAMTFDARVQRLDASNGAVEIAGANVDAAAAHLEADVIVLADGGANLDKLPQLEIREKDYGQSAMLGHVELDRPHLDIAYERFTPNGPLALLPSPDGASIASMVWVDSHAAIDALMALDDATACAQFAEAFGRRAGRMLSLTQRRRYPLRLRQASHRTIGRVAIIGNAAQAMHPVAGQGFNLGVRDASVLAQALADGSASEALRNYADNREVDVGRGVAFTDLLASGFLGDALPLRATRGAVLAAVDMLPFARRALATRMLFGARS
ncbi:MAG: FAD-dependent monooxygenase [Burkholderiales bacterium]|jgi:2-octaprenyl-6-methoxyphenol hydroxylase|nr:FAD-dependent monooxygenase [Nitrosomonadaceae bacterium]